MGALLRRNAVFGRLLKMIFFLLFLGIPIVVSDIIQCIKLDSNSVKDDFLTCYEEKMALEAVNKSFPVADFSEFSQPEFDNMTIIKSEHGDISEKVAFGRLFGGNFQAINSKLTNITIGFYVPRDKLPQSFILEDNWNLINVFITHFEDLKHLKSMQFIIRNNKRLSQASIDALKAVNYTSDSYIQDFGECSLDQNGLSSIEDLYDCHYTVNDLIINSRTSIPDDVNKTKLVLKKVGGCIRVNREIKADHKFLFDSFESANCSGSHDIVHYDKLCLTPEFVRNLSRRIGPVKYERYPSCNGDCTIAYFEETHDLACTWITGTLIIQNMPDNADLSHLANIKNILGRLVIKNNNFTEIHIGKMLPTLGTINAKMEKEPALLVQYNHNLRNFSMPNRASLDIRLSEFVGHKALYIMENGNFTFSDESKKQLKENLGTVEISVELEKPKIEITKIRHNSTASEESNNVEREQSKEEGKDHVAIIVSAVVLGPAGIIGLVAVCWVAFRKAKAVKKQVEKDHRTFDSMPMTNLGVTPFNLPVSFTDDTISWIKKAFGIIQDNENKIKIQVRERLEHYSDKDPIVLQNNSDPVLPIYSRNDAREDAREEEYEKKEYKESHELEDDSCKCKDEGVVYNGKAVFGVRMEEQRAKWQDKELERSHDYFFKYGNPVITYEELSASTMQLLERDSLFYISEDLLYQKAFGVVKQMGINASKIDFADFYEREEEKKMNQETDNEGGSRKRGCVMKFNVVVYTHKPELDSLSDVTELSVNKESVNIFRALQSTMKRQGDNKQEAMNHDSENPAPAVTKKGIKGNEEEERELLENLILAHMNCPLGKWLINFLEDDVIALCNKVKEGMKKEGVFQRIKQINVRIMGDIRGKFDDLRKGLCVPSGNSSELHPIFEKTHVFLGNYVGPFGQNMEVLCLLFALKVRFPKKYVLLRGPLEWRQMGDASGLKVEIFTRFKEKPHEVWDAVNDVFDVMPLACKVGLNVLCTNAGVAPRMGELENLSLPITSLEVDTLPFNLMFAQPNWTVKRYFDNVEQKAGYYFGFQGLKTALAQFKCDVLFCSKMLPCGYGMLGYNKRIITLYGHQTTEKDYIAQAEYSGKGNLEIQVIHVPQPHKVVFSDAKAYNLNPDQKEKTKSRMGAIPNTDKKGNKGKPTTDKDKTAPATDKNKGKPALDKDKTAPATDKNKGKSALDKDKTAPATDKNKGKSALDRKKDPEKTGNSKSSLSKGTT